MALHFKKKEAIVNEVAQVARNALSVVAADYQGLSVGQMNRFRSQARDAGIMVKVVQNRLARRAFEGTDFACLIDALVGPLVLVFSQEEPGAGARLVRDFAKENEQLKVKSVSIDGKAMDATHLSALASLPTYDESISMLMRVIQAPVERFVRTLAEPTVQCVRVLSAVGDQKQSA